MAHAASESCVLYGATGFTGRRLAETLRRRGCELQLAGRSADKLRALGAELDLPQRTCDLQKPAQIAALLAGAELLVNAAGPFSATAPPLIAACLERGVHYLDITGEALMIEHAARFSHAARAAGVMLLPGIGFDVVPSDCLAVHVARRLPQATRLSIGLSGLSWPSRGSAKTMIDLLDQPIWARRRGTLCEVPVAARERDFDYGGGARASVAVAWGDIVSAHFSTGIPDITTYFEATSAVRIHTQLMRWFGWAIPGSPWQPMLTAAAEFLPEGPSAAALAQRQAVIVAEVEDDHGRRARARLRTPEVYAFTAEVAAEIILRVLGGDVQPGFQTACRLYGPEFVLMFDGVVREDL
jgi:short subunit dehydrogenase-like uncharacterized protein